jgi:maleylpyruvate isomerase
MLLTVVGIVIDEGEPGGTRVSDELLATIVGCTDAHRHLERRLESIDHAILRRASRLPGWTVAHVLTHLARNAESHVRMLGAASEGRSVEQYAGG